MSNILVSEMRKPPVSLIFSALSDPLRLQIVKTLLEEKELPCGHCPASRSKSTMSHHFKVLIEAGIVKKREDGKTHHLSVRTEELERALPGILAVIKKAKAP